MAQMGSCLLSLQRTRFDPRPVCGNLSWTVLTWMGLCLNSSVLYFI